MEKSLGIIQRANANIGESTQNKRAKLGMVTNPLIVKRWINGMTKRGHSETDLPPSDGGERPTPINQVLKEKKRRLINIQICKGNVVPGTWNARIGDIETGDTNMYNASKKDILDLISIEMK